MKKIFLNLFFILFVGLTFNYAQKIPQSNKTIFSEEALLQSVLSLDGENKNIQQILTEQKGKIVILDIWATWCKDCLEGLPQLEILQNNNPDVAFIFLSVDKKEDAWKKGIEKYNIQGKHYWFDSGWKNEFNTYIDLNWVPRYLIIDRDGNIAKYYAVKADDPTIQETLNALKSK